MKDTKRNRAIQGKISLTDEMSKGFKVKTRKAREIEKNKCTITSLDQITFMKEKLN